MGSAGRPVLGDTYGMRTLSVVVLGAGPAGLAVALALGRDGHRVTLVERDPVVVDEPSAASSWQRGGIPHFHQPHAFIPRGRLDMREAFPDVFRTLIDNGAWDLDVRSKIRGPSRPEDRELTYLAARRPLIEWALRRAVSFEPAIRVMSGVDAMGYEGTNGDMPLVTGVVTSSGSIKADLVVDAMGRRTKSASWIGSLGGRPVVERRSDCGIIYYSRYYRVRDGQRLPDGPWLLGPRADLGYGVFATFPGDNGAFAASLGIRPGDQELKSLKHTAAFDAAVATMPALHAWTNADTAEPITDVLPMGSLQNTLRMPDGEMPGALGLIGVGDALCHTDPALALGLAFSLSHARLLAMVLRDHAGDPGDLGRAFLAAAGPEMEERFAYTSAIDEARSRSWAGESVDIAHRDGGAYALFTLAAGSAAAMVDGDVFRAVVRRNAFLDPLAVLDDDVAMQQRIETIFGDLMRQGRPMPGPGRDDLVAVVHEAIRRAD